MVTDMSFNSVQETNTCTYLHTLIHYQEIWMLYLFEFLNSKAISAYYIKIKQVKKA